MSNRTLSGAACLRRWLGAFALLGSCVYAQDATQDAAVKTLPKLVASGDLDEAVIAPDRPIANKGDIPVNETPQAISVVTAQDIKQQNVTRLADALRGVAGVSRSSTYGFFDAYTIRGYDAAYGSVFLDGLATTNVAGTNNELAGLEQVEVVKGPASALFGAAPLGGIVNLVSKRPRNETFVEAGIATGSYDLIEGSLDANAPLTTTGSVLARLNVLYRDTKDFVRFSGKNRLFIAPAVTFNIGSSTTLTLLPRYQRDRDNPWSPVIAYGTVLPSAYGELAVDFPVNRGGAYRAVIDQDTKQIGYVLDHYFSDAVTFSQTVRYSQGKTYWNNWSFSDAVINPNFIDGVQQSHVWGLDVYGPFWQTDNDFGADNRLLLKFDGALVSHAVLAGIDYKRSSETHHDDGGNFDTSINTLDVIHPDYYAPLVHDPIWGYSAGARTRQVGYYLQDHLGIRNTFYVTLGARWDQTKDDAHRDHGFSPHVGLNYFITPSTALYANWSKSFTPQSSGTIDINGKVLPPETGRNIEAGVKVASVDGKLNAQLAVFELTRQNVANSDPHNPFFYVVTGEQRSRGLELEGAWQATPAFTASLAYTYLDAAITRDTTIAVGTQLANVPRHNLYVGGAYLLQSGPLAGFGINAALLYNSKKNSSLYPYDYNGDGVDDPAIPLPSYVLVDAGVSYAACDWDARLSLNNAFDKRYYPDAGYYTRITPGEPRNWRLAVSRKF